MPINVVIHIYARCLTAVVCHLLLSIPDTLSFGASLSSSVATIVQKLQQAVPWRTSPESHLGFQAWQIVAIAYYLTEQLEKSSHLAFAGKVDQRVVGRINEIRTIKHFVM